MTIQEKMEQAESLRITAEQTLADLAKLQKTESVLIAGQIAGSLSAQCVFVNYVLEELQKMQQPKVCKWELWPDGVGVGDMAHTECGKVHTMPWKAPLYCEYCGGKVESKKAENYNKI